MPDPGTPDAPPPGPTLAEAQRACATARAAAGDVDAVVSVAVVDAGGVLVCFERADRAEIAGPVLAVDKAYTALAHRCATAELAPLVAPGGPLAGMHANGGGRYVCFGGGVPLRAGGVVVGGLGVSGGSAEQDAAAAERGAQAFQRSRQGAGR